MARAKKNFAENFLSHSQWMMCALTGAQHKLCSHKEVRNAVPFGTYVKIGTLQRRRALLLPEAQAMQLL
eukprot:scaffold3170_cov23-Tisochrysis_lutea.AAC.5